MTPLPTITDLRSRNFLAVRNAVLAYYGLTWEQANVQGPRGEIAECRHMIMYLSACEIDEISHEYITQQFTCSLDRSNVTRAINNIARDAKKYAKTIKAIKRELYGRA